MSVFDFLHLVLQSSNKFDLKVSFEVLLILVITVYEVYIYLLFQGPVHFTGLFGLS